MINRWAAVFVVLAGCGGDPIPDDPEPIDPAGTHHTYIVSSIELPRTSARATELGFNLDEDEGGSVHNRVGQILALLLGTGDYGDRVEAEIDARIAAGELIHLFDVQAVALDDADRVGWWAFRGVDPDEDASDNWPGPEIYEVTSQGEPAVGDIVDGTLTAARGRLPLSVALPNVAAPIVLDLYAASIEASITAADLSGRIGGGIREADIDRVLLPALELGLQQMVIDSCGATGPCPQGSLGELLLDYLDVDGDGAISQQDLRESSLINELLTPDVDLFDENGELNPRADGIRDSLSIAVGFAAVPAVFAPQPTP